MTIPCPICRAGHVVPGMGTRSFHCNHCMRCIGVETMALEVERLTKERDSVAADRDEWRTQHENLLAMHQREVARGALVFALTGSEFGALSHGLRSLQCALQQVHQTGAWSIVNAQHWADEAAFYLTETR